MAAGLRTIVLAGLVVGGIDGFVLPDLKLADVLSVRDRLAGALGPNAEPLLTQYTLRQLPSETRPMPIPG
jgi:hypothetical protein